MEYFCRMCHTPFVSAYSLDESDLCAACRQSLVHFDSAYSFGGYEGALKGLIGLFKYAKVETLAEPLSRLLLKSLPTGENFDVIIAMPMHWRKKWQRGFNQAELLAAPVARRYGLKMSNCLQRVRYTAAQAGLNELQRQENLKNSFEVRRREAVTGKRILLIDDVFTTGATLRAAAAALKGAGAARVTALTLARVDQRQYQPDGRRARLQPTGKQMGFNTSAASELRPWEQSKVDDSSEIGGGRYYMATADRLHRPVLVLNASYEPINICAARRALVLILKGVASAEETAPSQIHSAKRCLNVPSVIRLLEYRRIPHQTRALSRKNILMRDRYTCQYCHKSLPSGEMTLDHVIPRSRSGETTWENLVACCHPCNNRKGNRTPDEAGMKLTRPPRPFSLHTSRHLMRLLGRSDDQWRKYLFYSD